MLRTRVSPSQRRYEVIKVHGVRLRRRHRSVSDVGVLKKESLIMTEVAGSLLFPVEKQNWQYSFPNDENLRCGSTKTYAVVDQAYELLAAQIRHSQ